MPTVKYKPKTNHKPTLLVAFLFIIPAIKSVPAYVIYKFAHYEMDLMPVIYDILVIFKSTFF